MKSSVVVCTGELMFVTSPHRTGRGEEGIQVSETQLTGSPNIHLSGPPVAGLSCGIWGLTGETGMGAVNKSWWKSSCSVQRSLWLMISSPVNTLPRLRPHSSI